MAGVEGRPWMVTLSVAGFGDTEKDLVLGDSMPKQASYS